MSEQHVALSPSLMQITMTAFANREAALALLDIRCLRSDNDLAALALFVLLHVYH